MAAINYSADPSTYKTESSNQAPDSHSGNFRGFFVEGKDSKIECSLNRTIYKIQLWNYGS